MEDGRDGSEREREVVMEGGKVVVWS